MLKVFSSKIINHCFHINNDKGELGIGYDRIIVHDLMVQLSQIADFKPEILQGYGEKLPMEEPIGLIDKSD